MPGHIDVDNWRRRIREDCAGRYHREMGTQISVRENNLEAAIAHFREAARQQPSHPASQWLLMDALIQAGRGDEAAGLRNEAEAAAPRFAVRGRCYQALRFMADETFAPAAHILDQAVALEPDSTEVAGCRRLLRVLQDKAPNVEPPFAIADPELAREIAGWVLGLTSRPDFQKPAVATGTLSLFDWVPVLDRECAGDALALKGSFLFEKLKAYDAALEAVEEAIRISPSATAHLIRAAVLLASNQNRVAEAEEDLQRLLLLDPTHIKGRIRLWSLRQMQGRQKAIITDIAKFLQDTPNLAGTFRQEIDVQHAIALHILGDLQQARPMLLALNRAGGLLPAHMWLLALENAALGFYDEAFSVLDRAGALPTATWNSACRALVHLARGDLEQALAEALPAAATGTVWERSILAQIHEARGSQDEAEQLYRQVVTASAPQRLWFQAHARLIGAERVLAAYDRLGLSADPHWPGP